MLRFWHWRKEEHTKLDNRYEEGAEQPVQQKREGRAAAAAGKTADPTEDQNRPRKEAAEQAAAETTQSAAQRKIRHKRQVHLVRRPPSHAVMLDFVFIEDSPYLVH